MFPSTSGPRRSRSQKKVSAVQTTDSITFIAASDAHHHSDDEYIADGNLHAGMAMKALSYILPGIDFCCFLGDYSIGSETTTLAQGRQHFAEINAILKEGFGGIPQFRTPGDRDGLRRALGDKRQHMAPAQGDIHLCRPL